MNTTTIVNFRNKEADLCNSHHFDRQVRAFVVQQFEGEPVSPTTARNLTFPCFVGIKYLDYLVNIKVLSALQRHSWRT